MKEVFDGVDDGWMNDDDGEPKTKIVEDRL